MGKYRSEIKDEARLLRLAGFSLNQIQQKMDIPRTTIRDWISDIVLTPEQQSQLKYRILKALHKGRIKAEKKQRRQRRSKERSLFVGGKKEVGKLNLREFFIAGVALYWAEGFKNKHEHRLGFCNSDPNMIIFYINWLQKALKIDKSILTARLTLNISFKERETEIKEYWAETTGIPLNQFTKTFYQNTKWKKQYTEGNYYGVLRIHVKESLDYLLKMKGWIEGLKLI